MKTNAEIIAFETWQTLPDKDPTSRSSRSQRTPAEFMTWANKIADALSAKDVEMLIEFCAHGPGFNDGTKRGVFQIIGQPLPKNIAGIKAALYAWAGITPEEQAARAAAKRAAREREAFESDLRGARRQAEALSFRIEGEIRNGVAAVDGWIAAGFNRLAKWGKPSAVPRWSLANETGNSWPVNGALLRYARLKLQMMAETSVSGSQNPSR